ncbi:MAG: hypothetical protein O3A81_01780 [bacterium]|nr:hypothetical protein [bacterium]
MSLTVRTILQRVNAQAAVTGWGIIESEKTIHRVVSEHYQEARLKHAGDLQGFEQGLREAAYESMCQMREGQYACANVKEFYIL